MKIAKKAHKEDNSPLGVEYQINYEAYHAGKKAENSDSSENIFEFVFEEFVYFVSKITHKKPLKAWCLNI